MSRELLSRKGIASDCGKAAWRRADEGKDEERCLAALGLTAWGGDRKSRFLAGDDRLVELIAKGW
jgi:hypothetical protein